MIDDWTVIRRRRRWIGGSASLSHASLRHRARRSPRGTVRFGGHFASGQVQLDHALLQHRLDECVLLGVARFAYIECDARVLQPEVLAQAPLTRLRVVAERTSAPTSNKVKCTPRRDHGHSKWQLIFTLIIATKP